MRLFFPSLLCILFFTNISSVKAIELYCPPDVWVNCNAEIWDLSIYGSAYYIKNGQQYSAGSASVVYDLTTCNTGIIYRTWTIEDQYWNLISCTQKIHVSGGSFSSYHIDWPDQNLHLYGCSTSTHPNDLPYGYGYPQYAYVSCSHIGISYKDQVFTFGPDCKKIIRKWTLIDWCNYLPNSGSNQGLFSYSQIIKLSNTDTPILSCPKKLEVDATECDSMFVDAALVSVEGMSCTGDYSIINDSPFALNNGADASGTYPIGTTQVDYLVEYACGKEKVCRTDIVVYDKKPAVPYCYSTLNVSLMPQDTDNDGQVDDGMVEIWAKDFDVNSYHPCNNGPLKFTFSSDLTDTYRILTCEDVGPNNLQMWVTDKLGNQSYCAVTLNVQNNAANIPDCEYVEEGNKYVLHGRITNEEDNYLENVVVYVKDKDPIYDYEMDYDTVNTFEVVDSFYNQSNALVYVYEMTTIVQETAIDSTPFYNVMYLNTDRNGIYGSNNVLFYRNYKINAFKEGDMTRVDQQDLDLLINHVNGSQPLSSPYSLLAADINEDMQIDEEDINLLSEIISGEEDEWPLERQWVFYNKDEFMGMSSNPLAQADPISHTVAIENFENESHELDFIGILKGDIDKYETPEEEGRATLIELKSRADLSSGVFPNPFVQELYFRTDADKGAVQLTIYNLEGKKLINQTIESTKGESKIQGAEQLEAGTYLYRIISETGEESGKVIKI